MQGAKTLLWTLITLFSAFFILFIILLLLPSHPGVSEHKAIILSIFIPQDLSFLSASEADHMRDVGFLIKWAALVFLVTLVFAEFFHATKDILRNVQIATLGIIALGVIISITGTFATLWKYFHVIFFPQGNWAFPATSTLITLYPETYFLGATLILVGAVLLLPALYRAKTLLKK